MPDKPLISITLPSLYPDCLVRALKNIRDAARLPVQILVVSPFKPPSIDGIDDKVLWIEDIENTGCNAGHAKAYASAIGSYIFPWVDDHLLVDGFDVLALQRYEEREALFHAQPGKKGKPFVLGLRHAFPHHVGCQFGIHYSYFPLTRKKYTDKVGWFDPQYRRGFADGDLCLRFWEAGGRVEWADKSLCVVHHDDDRKSGVVMDQADMDLFVSRWAPKYGQGWDTTTIRGFNMDIEPYVLTELVSDFTVYHNSPDFRDIALAGGWRP